MENQKFYYDNKTVKLFLLATIVWGVVAVLLPGIAAKAVFEVITAVSTVASLLALYGSDWITSTGRRLAGRLPDGAPKSAQ